MNNLFMKILKITNMKLKLSTQLLIGVALSAVISSFISGSILRKQYDKIDKTNKYWYYQKIVDQPFKHIKILQNAFNRDSSNTLPAIYGVIRFEKGNNHTVLSNRTSYSSRWSKEEGDTLSCKVMNDTLFVYAPYFTTYSQNGKDINYDLVLTAPLLESITCLNVGAEITGLNQDSIYFDLSGRSYVEYPDNPTMSLIKANIKDRAVLELSPLLKLKKLEVVLKDRSKLKMPIVPAEMFSIDAGDSTAIEGPSKFFKKKND